MICPSFVVSIDFDSARAGPEANRFTIASGAAASCQPRHQGVKFRGVGDPVLYI